MRYLGKNINHARVKNVPAFMRQSTFRNRPPKQRTLSRKSFMGGAAYENRSTEVLFLEAEVRGFIYFTEDN